MHDVRKLPFFLINTVLLYIPLLALMDGQKHGETNTLASRGLLEELPDRHLLFFKTLFYFFLLALTHGHVTCR